MMSDEKFAFVLGVSAGAVVLDIRDSRIVSPRVVVHAALLAELPERPDGQDDEARAMEVAAWADEFVKWQYGRGVRKKPEWVK
jgi:hypothetical protein